MVSITAFVDEGLGNSSYLVDLGDGRALVVDPTRDVGPYARLADQRGLELAYSLETHLHADFISGSRELAQLGATVLAPREGGLAFPHRGLDHAEEVELGGLTLRAIGTPGHTPEHLAFLLLDGPQPLALFSGGALLVGGVARTDLIGPDDTVPLARRLHRALQDRIATLPDPLAVYPTHGSGSFCSTDGGSERTTTIGHERATNPFLSTADQGMFVRRLMDGLGTFPGYFLRLREVNRRGPRVYGAHPPRLRELTTAAVEAHLRDGGPVVDVRPIEAFAEGHIGGALSIAFRPAFASWLGSLVAAEGPLVFVADADQDRVGIVRDCLKIGYDDLAGELGGGMSAWRAAGLPERRTLLIPTSETPLGPVLDVRQAAEYVGGHVPGALHIELGSLADGAEDPATASATVMCGHGERAMTAASLLERTGGSPSVYLGGPRDWSRAQGRPLATGA
jgi:glyoxylase-like metal-dependent hydrolase (beta-lactamase superfamily II)/rhodanese-related sulfurtransferase